MPINIFRINPELQRNIWSEISLSRLIIMPVIVAFSFLLIYIFSYDFRSFVDFSRNWSFLLFIILVFLWGNRAVSGSVVKEVQRQTWDNIRLTAISPLQLTIGKLFGSTIYTWYGALYAVAGYVYFSSYYVNPVREWKFIALMVFIGILSHAVTLSITLMGVKKNREDLKIHSDIYFVFGVILSAILI